MEVELGRGGRRVWGAGFVRGGLCRQKRINTGAPVCWSGQQNKGRKAENGYRKVVK